MVFMTPLQSRSMALFAKEAIPFDDITPTALFKLKQQLKMLIGILRRMVFMMPNTRYNNLCRDGMQQLMKFMMISGRITCTIMF